MSDEEQEVRARVYGGAYEPRNYLDRGMMNRVAFGLAEYWRARAEVEARQNRRADVVVLLFLSLLLTVVLWSVVFP